MLKVTLSYTITDSIVFSQILYLHAPKIYVFFMQKDTEKKTTQNENVGFELYF